MPSPRRILLCAGTRPELIKLAPVYRDLRDRALLRPCLCLTGQHDSLVRDLPRQLGITADYILEKGHDCRGQTGLMKSIFRHLPGLLEQVKPQMVLVQGDTASALGTALVARLQDIPVGHVEAGLRTHDLFSPFPEELYRQLISRIGSWHFCPTANNQDSLLKEDVPLKQTSLCGNTSVDAVKAMAAQGSARLETKSSNRPYILVTLHRREAQGEKLLVITRALRSFAASHPAFDFVVTLHPNPMVRNLLRHHLSGLNNIRLLEPLDYPDFVPLMEGAFAILSDSGGIQEEAPALDVPVIVLREKTERQEGVDSGCLRLAGHDPDKIFSELSLLIDDPEHYIEISTSPSPFGDGRAGRIIGTVLEQILTGHQITHDDCHPSS